MLPIIQIENFLLAGLPQDLRPGLMAAEEQRDDLKACPLQWMYCHMMLLTGSRPEHVITVSAFLAHVKEVCHTANVRSLEISLTMGHAASCLLIAHFLSLTPSASSRLHIVSDDGAHQATKTKARLDASAEHSPGCGMRPLLV